MKINACHEKTLQQVEGKTKLVREEYCDGLGNCLLSSAIAIII